MLSHPSEILFISRADFPVGGGRTQRLVTLARAVRDAGWPVELWIAEPITGKIQLEWRKEGEVDGIPYRQFSESGSRRHRFQSIPQRVGRSFVIARELWRRKDVRLVIFNVPFLYDGGPVALVARMCGIPCVFAYEDERFRPLYERASLLRRLGDTVWLTDQRLCDVWLTPKVHGVIVISDYLRRKYKSLGCRRIASIPTLVDDREWRLREPNSGCPEFFYSGEAAQDIYEFSNLFRALARLRSRGVEFRLALVMGRPESFPAVAALVREVQAVNLQDCVEFIEFMPLAELKERMGQARFLLCLRKDTPLAQSGASTKLSEYLATGRVVIMTPVGDIGSHLQNRHNGLVPADTSVEAIERACSEALALDPAEERSIGERGRELARKLFNSSQVAEAIRLFLPAMAPRSN